MSDDRLKRLASRAAQKREDTEQEAALDLLLVHRFIAENEEDLAPHVQTHRSVEQHNATAAFGSSSPALPFDEVLCLNSLPEYGRIYAYMF